MDKIKECGGLPQKIFDLIMRVFDLHNRDSGDLCLNRITFSLNSFFGGKHRESLQFITFRKWFHNLFEEWEKQSAVPASSKFIIYLLSKFIMLEDNFKIAQNMNIIDKYEILSYKNMCQEDNFIPMRNDYVTYLVCIMSHHSGLTFIKEKKIWEKVVDLYFTESKDTVKKEGEKLLRSFLNHHMLREILQYTLKYATFIQKETIYIKSGGATSMVFFKENEELLPFLKFFASVLELCFEMQDNQIFTIPLFLIESIDIKFVLQNILETSEEEKLLDVAARLSAMLNFLLSASFSSNFITKIPDGTVENLKFLLKRRKTKIIMELVQSCRYIICKSNSKNGLVQFDPSLELDFLLFQLIPLLSFIKTRTKIKGFQHPTVQDPYIEKLCGISTETGREIVFLLRDTTQLPEENSENCVPQYSPINLFTRNHKDIVVEALIEILKEFNLRTCNEEDLGTSKLCEAARLISSSEEQLVSYILLFLLHEHLTFYEKGSEKTLQWLNVFIGFLKNYHHLYPRLAEKTLDLIINVLQNLILPDCPLPKILLEQYDFDDFISLLSELIMNEDYLVRLRSIMAVGKISELAEAKCPKVIEKLVKSNIFSQIVENAENNSDRDFKATALDTLAGMVLLKRLWEENLNMSDFSSKILKMIVEERDDEVRYSAILLAKKLYEHADCGSEYKKSCCKIFYRQSTLDPDWIIRRDSLEFWEMVLCQSLKSHDFVDGSFPKNISAEEKKFRLKSVLSELSGVGCLTALLHALNDSDVRVFEKCRDIVVSLLNILNKFNLMPPSPDRSKMTTGNPEMERLCGEHSTTNDERDIEIKSDRIIEDNVQNDNKALITVFDRTKSNKNLLESQVLTENVDPDFFIQTVKSYELENFFDEKLNLLKDSENDLNTLFNDLLRSISGCKKIHI